jgi:hypothetical protein
MMGTNILHTTINQYCVLRGVWCVVCVLLPLKCMCVCIVLGENWTPIYCCKQHIVDNKNMMMQHA